MIFPEGCNTVWFCGFFCIYFVFRNTEYMKRKKSPYPKPDKPELNRKTFNFPILWNHLLKDIAKKSAAYLVVTTA